MEKYTPVLQTFINICILIIINFSIISLLLITNKIKNINTIQLLSLFPTLYFYTYLFIDNNGNNYLTR